eukprot:757490-Hanusia_phi.AAC.3
MNGGYNSPRLILVASEPIWRYVVDQQGSNSPGSPQPTLRRNSSSSSLYESVLEARMKLTESKTKSKCEIQETRGEEKAQITCDRNFRH